jgi:hypothetical protein
MVRTLRSDLDALGAELATTASTPFSGAARTRYLRFTQRFSVSSQKRCVWRFGRKRRRRRLLACDTVLPLVGRLPVT